ncbi:MAG: DUF2029 domain-containing protein [Chloroflexi bacterium]|nr:DUF2029 domain-containing protein [Chloroflexota bacterium]
MRRVVGGHPAAARALLPAFVIMCVIVDVLLVYTIVRGGGFTHDSYAYWSVDLAAPFTANVGEKDAFLYSPAAAQVFALLGLLPWEVFLLGWMVLQVGIVLYLSGRSWWWVLPLPPVFFECIVGNVHLLYAAAIRLGFRFPWMWALMLLTKVTPVVGLVWFLVRREWRALGIALGATAAIVAISYLFAPDLWRQWVDLLTTQSGGDVPDLAAVRVPLTVRVAIAAVIVAWGAWTDRPWVLPIAVLLAQPVIWVASLSILVGVLPLRGARGRAIAAQSRGRGREWYRA